MAYIKYKKVWVSEFDNIVSTKDKMQDLNPNQLKLEVHDTYKRDKKLTTIFEAANVENIMNKAFLVRKLTKLECHLSLLEKDDNEFKLLSNKQSNEEVLVQRAVKRL